jgi:hypothetical protein
MKKESLSTSKGTRKLQFPASFEEMELDQLTYNLSLSPEERFLAHKKLAMKVCAKELSEKKPAPRVLIFK